jgi:hypothetical protein
LSLPEEGNASNKATERLVGTTGKVKFAGGFYGGRKEIVAV